MEIDIAAVSLEFHGSQVEFRQAMKSLERFRFRYGDRKKFLFLEGKRYLEEIAGGDDSIRRWIFGSSFESSATIGSVSLLSRKKVKAGIYIYKPCSFVIADQLGSICMMYRR